MGHVCGYSMCDGKNLIFCKYNGNDCISILSLNVTLTTCFIFFIDQFLQLSAIVFFLFCEEIFLSIVAWLVWSALKLDTVLVRKGTSMLLMLLADGSFVASRVCKVTCKGHKDSKYLCSWIVTWKPKTFSLLLSYYDKTKQMLPKWK